jgi:selenocysteine-specific elongation factor
VKGFGTVATGTLISGSVAKEQEVEVYPAGRRLRVRGVQVHGGAAARAVAGQRTAINLADIEPADLGRGDVLSEPGRFRAVKQIDCRLHLLPSAKPLKHRAPVHFHSGTAEIEAEVRLLEGTAAMRPGSTAYVRLILRQAALLLPGDSFIIRMFSPVVTIGGGVVVDTMMDTGGRRYRKGDDVKARLDTLSGADAAARIALLVREAAFGMGMADLVARTGMAEREIAAAAALAPVVCIAQPQAWYLDTAWMQAERERIVRTVREFHRQTPLVPGMARQELRGGAPVFVLDALLAGAKELVAEGETVRAREHKVVLKEDEEEARARIERAFEGAGLAVPAMAEVLAKSGVEASRARSLLQILLRERRLVRISAELVFHQSAIGQLRELLGRHKGERFRVPEFKEWTGISRKYAIPLLEFLDRERITRREGDERVVL